MLLKRHTLRTKSPVRELGAIRSAFERRQTRRARSGTPPKQVLEGERSAREAQHDTQAKLAEGGVIREANAQVLAARKAQTRWDVEAERTMTGAAVAAARVAPGVSAEHGLHARLLRYAPETMAYVSPWLARLASIGLFIGGCILNATTYAEFEPAREDALSRLLESAGVSTAWALGAFQMAGFTFLGYAIAYCISYALVPRRRQYGTPAGQDPRQPDPDADRRIVYGYLSARVYGIFALLFFAFALTVGYAIAHLRLYGTLLDASAAASAPGTGAAGSLGGAAAGAEELPNQMLVFMVLAMLELVATIAVFVCLDPAIARTLRGLRKNTERELRYAEKRAVEPNEYRIDGANAGLDAHAAVNDVPIRRVQAKLHAAELDALLRASHPAEFPAAFDPDLPELRDNLPDAGPLELGHTAPLKLPDLGGPSASEVLAFAGHAVVPYDAAVDRGADPPARSNGASHDGEPRQKDR